MPAVETPTDRPFDRGLTAAPSARARDAAAVSLRCACGDELTGVDGGR